MLGIPVTIFFLLLIVKDYKRGIILTAMTIQLLSFLGTGIPGLKIYTVLTFFAILMFFFKRKGYFKSAKYPKQLCWTSLFFVLSFFISEIFSRIGPHWFTIVANIGTYFVFPYLFWKSVDSEERVRETIRILYWLMMVAVLYGMVELILRWNPLTFAITTLFRIEDFVIDAHAIRYGLKRCNSIFAYFTTYGTTCVLSSVIFLSMIVHFKCKKKSLIVLFFLSLFGAFSTGSRAIFLGIMSVCFFMFLQKRFFKTNVFYIILLISICLLPVLLDVFTQVANSMLDSSGSQGVQGSTSEMREMQWDICYQYFVDSPWIGNGRMFIWEYVKPRHKLLLGAESIWFSIFVDYGIMGAFAFLNLIFMSSWILIKKNFCYVCVPLAYLLILSLSPDQGVQYNLLLTFTILLVKMHDYKLGVINVFKN